MTLPTQRGVICSILLAFSYLVKWFLPQKLDISLKLEVIIWLLEFDWELQLNSTKNNILKVGFCWQSAKILLQRIASLNTQQLEKWHDFKKQKHNDRTGCYNLPTLLFCLQKRKRRKEHFALWIHLLTVFLLHSVQFFYHLFSPFTCLQFQMLFENKMAIWVSAEPRAPPQADICDISITLSSKNGKMTNWHLVNLNSF